MFCPKCASQNIDGASFCRVCGANISLVPQALTGQLSEARPTETDLDWGRGRRSRRKKNRAPASLEKGVNSVFVGVGFLLAAIALMATGVMGGRFWGWTLFFPAFGNIGGGVAMIAAWRASKGTKQSVLPAGSNRPAASTTTALGIDPVRGQVARPRPTGELLASPPSVTEGTTRHLGAEAPTRHLDS